MVISDFPPRRVGFNRLYGNGDLFMVVKSFHHLEEAQEEQIRELEELCSQHETPALQSYVYLSSDMNRNPKKNCFYLLYEDGILVSFLSVFAPRQEGEISAFTHPEYRRRGYFTELLKRMRQDWKELSQLLFVAEPASKSARAVLDSLGAAYDFSEYMMYYGGNIPKRSPARKNNTGRAKLQLRKAKPADETVMSGMLASIFSMQEQDAADWYHRLMEEPSVHVFQAVSGNSPIGVGALSDEGDRMTLFALGIKKALRGRGYGRDLLQLLIEYWQENFGEKELLLETDSHSARAVSLFRRHGFSIATQFDYYRLSMK